MPEANAAIIVSILSAVVSIATAAGLEYSRRRSSREIELVRSDQQRELEGFKDELSRTREAANKAEEAQRTIARYRDPLLRSAFDLNSRLYNTLRLGGFRGQRDPEYFRLNTLFVIGEFFGWLEIIRREMQFLDLGAIEATVELNTRIASIQESFATGTRWSDEFYIFRGHQRAMGEIMMSRVEPMTTGPRYECIGYAAFVTKYADSGFRRWFERVEAAIELLPTVERDRIPSRLIAIQHAVVDLIDLLDPESKRFAASRDRLPANLPTRDSPA